MDKRLDQVRSKKEEEEKKKQEKQRMASGIIIRPRKKRRFKGSKVRVQSNFLKKKEIKTLNKQTDGRISKRTDG